MTIPHFTHTEFIEYLESKGCEVLTDEFFNDLNRFVIKTPAGTIATIQYRKTHYYPKVVRTCLNINIDPPKDHLECYNQTPPSKRKS